MALPSFETIPWAISSQSKRMIAKHLKRPQTHGETVWLRRPTPTPLEVSVGVGVCVFTIFLWIPKFANLCPGGPKFPTGPVPGALALFRALGGRVTFLSARPPIWEGQTRPMGLGAWRSGSGLVLLQSRARSFFRSETCTSIILDPASPWWQKSCLMHLLRCPGRNGGIYFVLLKLRTQGGFSNPLPIASEDFRGEAEGDFRSVFS